MNTEKPSCPEWEHDGFAVVTSNPVSDIYD